VIRTSYFANRALHGDPRCVAISLGVPRGWHGRWLRCLAPTSQLLKSYRVGSITWEEYARSYHWGIVLGRQLRAEEVVALLGPDAIMLCWERPSQPCHRRLLAHWLESELGILVPEWEAPLVEVLTLPGMASTGEETTP
jgi:uncharacterized protein YeaO (DUF488 family)